MKIVIDSGIPYIEGVFEPFAEVVYRLGSDICADTVRDADALIIRTRTRCDDSLLRGSKVRHIATATIGFDHIDTEYCHAQGITVTSSAGCNARAVLHWMGAVLEHLSRSQGWEPEQKTVGIVGVGNVGSLVKEYCQAWGFRVVCCDPPRAQREGISEFYSLQEVACQADILTLHTPLDESTYHFIDRDILDIMPSGATLINASRGAVVDSEALKSSGTACVLDVWEGEPDINNELLQSALLATYHIAGYSQQGKANATSIVVGDIAKSFSLPIEGWYPDVEHISPRLLTWQELKQSIKNHMDIASESTTLKSHRADFEHLRNSYNYRGEFF